MKESRCAKAYKQFMKIRKYFSYVGADSILLPVDHPVDQLWAVHSTEFPQDYLDACTNFYGAPMVRNSPDFGEADRLQRYELTQALIQRHFDAEDIDSDIWGQM